MDKRLLQAIEKARSYGHSYGWERPIILAGHPKSGNTWLRLTYHNLIRATNEGRWFTLTYSALNKANPNVAFPASLAADGFVEPQGIDHRGFPLMFHSHDACNPAWREFGNVIYIWRHPLDALIGCWYAQQSFPVDVERPQPIDEFMLQYLPNWIEMHKSCQYADVVVRYEDLITDDVGELTRLFGLLGLGDKLRYLKRAVRMSRIGAIRRMEWWSGQYHGHRADPERRKKYGLSAWRADARFMRSGKTGQWETELKPETILEAFVLLNDARILI